jgi:hypothetical protein
MLDGWLGDGQVFLHLTAAALVDLPDGEVVTLDLDQRFAVADHGMEPVLARYGLKATFTELAAIVNSGGGVLEPGDRSRSEAGRFRHGRNIPTSVFHVSSPCN